MIKPTDVLSKTERAIQNCAQKWEEIIDDKLSKAGWEGINNYCRIELNFPTNENRNSKFFDALMNVILGYKQNGWIINGDMTFDSSISYVFEFSKPNPVKKE